MDLPPFIWSPAAIQEPKFAAILPSSNVLTRPLAELGGTAVRRHGLACFSVQAGDGELDGGGLVGSLGRPSYRIRRARLRWCMSRFQIESISGVTSKSTVRFSPGLSVTRSKAVQLHHWLRDRCDALVHVELRDFIAFARAGVRDVDADLGRSRRGASARAPRAGCRT